MDCSDISIYNTGGFPLYAYYEFRVELLTTRIKTLSKMFTCKIKKFVEKKPEDIKNTKNFKIFNLESQVYDSRLTFKYLSPILKIETQHPHLNICYIRDEIIFVLNEIMKMDESFKVQLFVIYQPYANFPGLTLDLTDFESIKFESSNVEECSICLGNKKQMTYLRCLHYGVCKKCYIKLKNVCPFCRTVSRAVSGKIEGSYSV